VFPVPDMPPPTWKPTPAPADWTPPGPPPGTGPAPYRSAPFDRPAAPWSPAPPSPPGRSGSPEPSGVSGLGLGRGPIRGNGNAGDHADSISGGGLTTGGLTRRVRGAQLPQTQPVRMHRGPDVGAPRPAAPTTPPLRTPEQRRRADDVYSFLSSFTAGVQRGLNEAGGGDKGR
jgi:hypothetical protein